MQINDHPVWIKVNPEMNRFAYHQNGFWNIGNIKSLPKILAENAKNPKKKFIGYISSENRVEFLQEAKWNDRRNILKPHPAGDGKVVVKPETPEEKVQEAKKTKKEKEKEDEPPEDSDKPQEPRKEDDPT